MYLIILYMLYYRMHYVLNFTHFDIHKVQFHTFRMIFLGLAQFHTVQFTHHRSLHQNHDCLHVVYQHHFHTLCCTDRDLYKVSFWTYMNSDGNYSFPCIYTGPTQWQPWVLVGAQWLLVWDGHHHLCGSHSAADPKEPAEVAGLGSKTLLAHAPSGCAAWELPW